MTKKKTKQENREAIQDQINKLQIGIERELATKERYQSQVDVWQELMALKIEGIKKGMLKPEYSHHMNPRFWELQAQEMQFKVEEETATQQGQAAQYDYKINAYQQEIDMLTKELEKLGEE